MFSIKSYTLHGILIWTIAQNCPNGADLDLFPSMSCRQPEELYALIAELRADRAIDAGDEASLLADLASI